MLAYKLIFPIIYLGLDVIHDWAVLKWSISKGDKRKYYSWIWHSVDAIIKGGIALLVYWLWSIAPGIILTKWLLVKEIAILWFYFMALRYAPFGIGLNLIRGKKWNHSGTGWWDKYMGKYMIPQFILLLISILLIIFIL